MVRLNINGNARDIDANPDTPLLWAKHLAVLNANAARIECRCFQLRNGIDALDAMPLIAHVLPTRSWSAAFEQCNGLSSAVPHVLPCP
jgi:hypothetical protein